MQEIISQYADELANSAFVIFLTLLLMYSTSWTMKKIIANTTDKHPNAPIETFDLVRRILNALWLVLGIMILYLIIFGTKNIAESKSHFKLIIYIGVVSIATIVLASTINVWFIRSIEKKVREKEDPTSFKFLRYIAVFLVYFVGLLFCLIAFPSLKGVSQTALGGAGVLALIAGVASQEALSNLVGGVFIVAFKPFKIGDTIEISGSLVGVVTDITLRHTVIKNFANKMIVIPNAIINKEKLLNYDLNEQKICERIEIGISYDSNVQLAKKILQEECLNHPLLFDVRSGAMRKKNLPIVKVALISLNDSSVTIRAWAWARNYDHAFDMKCDILESVKLRFENEGIKLPFPTHTVYINKVENNESDFAAVPKS